MILECFFDHCVQRNQPENLHQSNSCFAGPENKSFWYLFEVIVKYFLLPSLNKFIKNNTILAYNIQPMMVGLGIVSSIVSKFVCFLNEIG